MSLLKTKPKWCATVEATDHGWINSRTGELLVSLRNLKTLLEQEETAKDVEANQVQEEEVQKATEDQIEIKEVVVKKPKRKQKILGEVVEHKLTNVIGEANG